MTEMHVCRTEIFSGKSVAHEDIKYEQACILYNLGKLLDPSMGPTPSPASPGSQLIRSDGQKVNG